MNDAVKEMLMNTLEHKIYVIQSCQKMAKHFWKIGEDEKALEILQRAAMHDNSKLSGQELEDLSKIHDGHASMKDPHVLLPEEQRKLLELHYANNTHYPEHWADITQMPEMDIVEMVCDWHANSTIHQTDLIEFVKVRQQNRFHFPPEMFEKILKYCQILVS